ncbi:probable cytochrome P450 313a4 isoform X2 [Teleopsis dalmanni]|nr:probable cytochrome P450 313a4 isoform X2 [Teleopsis dalmanni]
MLRGFGNIFKDCKQYTVLLWMGFYPIILTADPDIISNVLRSQDLINKAEVFYYSMRNAFKGGLISSKATEWVHNRKMINPSFSNKVLVSLFPIFNKSKNNLIGKFSALVDNKNHKILNMLQTLTLEIAIETTMGKVMHKGDGMSNNWAVKVSFVMKLTMIQTLLSFVKLDSIINYYIKFRRTKEELYQFVYELIRNKISTNTNNNSNNNNINTEEINPNNMDILKYPIPSIRKEPKIFIDQAIKLYENEQFTWNDIISESNNIVAAAFETTANAIFSTLVMLAMHPDVQQRLFEEILDVFPEKDFYVDCHQLTQLPYLNRVINETLRIAPSVPIIGRQVVEDTQIGEHVFPKDVQILISIYHLHRRTDIWGPNADKFDPEHFSVEHFGEMQRNAYIPFSKGVRGCIGSRYAIFSMKILLCGLVRNYEFETDFKFEDIRYTSNIALKYIVEPELKMYRRA